MCDCSQLDFNSSLTPRAHASNIHMSGVEAAGFVLAAFPLCISALEHYRESAEVLKDWWRYKREYRKVKVSRIALFPPISDVDAPLGRNMLPPLVLPAQSREISPSADRGRR